MKERKKKKEGKGKLSVYQLYFLRNYSNHKYVQLYDKNCWLASVGTLNLSDINWGLKSLKSLLSYAAAFMYVIISPIFLRQFYF